MKISDEDISIKAYELWIGRGCPVDSPEIDWYAAEALLQEASAETGDPGIEPREPGGTPRYGLRRFR